MSFIIGNARVDDLRPNLEKRYCQSQVEITKSPPVQPKMTESFAEQLFLGDDTWLGTLQGALMCLVTFGIGPLILLLAGYEDKLDTRYTDLKNELIDDINTANSGKGIDDFDCRDFFNWKEVSLGDLANFKTIIGELLTPTDPNLPALSQQDLKILIKIALAVHVHKAEILSNCRARYQTYQAGLSSPDYENLLILQLENSENFCSVNGDGKCSIVADGSYIRAKMGGGDCNLIEGKDFLSLYKSELNDMSLKWMDMSGKNLISANLKNSDLSRGKYTNADLSGAVMTDVKILGTNFSGATFNGDEEFTISIPSWTADTLDTTLNHITNSESGSVLTAIESISDRYSAHKRNLMHQLLDSFNGVDTSSVHDALLDIWMKNPLYLTSPKISSFIQEKILGFKILTANKSALVVNGEQELRLFLDMLKAKVGEEQRRLMLENNGFFIQLMMLCKGHANKAIRADAENLYDSYLSLEELKAYKEDHLPKKQYINDGLRTFDDTELGYVLVGKNQNTGIYDGLLLSRHNLNAMLYSEGDIDWVRLYYIESSLVDARTQLEAKFPDELDLEKISRKFILLNSAYQSHVQKDGYSQHLADMGLNFLGDNDLNLEPKNYIPIFEKAAKKHKLRIDFTGEMDEKRFKKIIAPLLATKTYAPINAFVEIDARLIEDAHYNKLIAAYDLIGKPNSEIAATFFLLSTKFAKLTSSYYFGEEENSPDALRAYAAGLMIKAHELDQSVFGSTEKSQSTTFKDFMQRLLGGDDAFTCTAVLSRKMLEHAKNHENIKMQVDKIIPGSMQ